MAFQCTALNVLFTAPGDTQDLIDAGFVAVGKWNENHAQDTGFVLIPRHYSRGAVSLFASGSDGQSIINDSLVADADIVISVFRERFGTPTPRAPSGTAEEIKVTLDSGRRLHIYFSEESRPPTVDLDQLRAVRDFKDGLTDGLWQVFDSPATFAELINRALLADARHFKGSPPVNGSPPAISAPAPVEPPRPPVELQIAVEGAAIGVTGAGKMMDDWITLDTKRELAAFEERTTTPSSVADYSLQKALGMTQPDPIKKVEFDARREEWEGRVRDGWSEGMDYLAGFAANALSFSILNDADSSVKNLRVDLTFVGAEGTEVVSASDFDMAEVFPSLFPSEKPYDPFAAARSSLRSVNNPVTWENHDGNLVVTIEQDFVRSRTPWKGGEGEVVLVLRDPLLSEVTVRWRATAESFEGNIDGELTVPVIRPTAQELFKEARAKSRRRN